jgi:WD40 repeat protein
MVLSPDGSTVAVSTGPNTNKLYLWHWQAGEEPHGLQVPDRAGNSLTFSPDGKLLVECETSRYFRVWDVDGGRLLHRLQPPEREWPNSAVFTPDGKTLVVACYTSRSGALHLWDVATWRHLHRWDAKRTSSNHLAVSPDSRLLASSGGGLVIWELPSARELSEDDEAHRADIAFVTATGSLIVTASRDDTIRIWDTATAKQRLKLTHEGWSRAVALSADEKLLATSGLNDTVIVWDFATGRKIYQFPGHGEFGGYRALGFTPDNKCLLSWGDDFYLRKWDVSTGKALMEHALRPTGVKVPDEDAEADEREMFDLARGNGTFAPDGRTFVLKTRNTFHIFDVETGKDVRQLTWDPDRIAYQAISPNSRLLLMSAWGKPIQTKLPDGRTRYSTEKDHALCLWDLTTGKQLRQTSISDTGAGPVTFSHDGNWYAAAINAVDKPRIQVFATATGQEIRTISGFPERVYSLAFNPDGSRLIAGLDDTTALVWDLSDKGKQEK